MLDSEFAFITRLERHFPHKHPLLLRGIGDDCALVTWPEKVLISTDLFLEDVHFRRSYFSPEQIGHKALAVNLSDIAAMGGTALGFSLGIMAPRSDSLSLEYWDGIMAGMARLASRFNVPLIGGDCSRGPCLGLSITVWGESERPLLRGQCSPGDAIFVCGPEGAAGLPLGLARSGFLALEELGLASLEIYPQATAAHLQPEPMLAAATVLASNAGVRSLMDLSDGLATDLPRLLGAEIAPHEGKRLTHGAALRMALEDLHPEVLELSSRLGRDPLREALLGGEDYCLLGVCESGAVEKLADNVPGFACIGEVTAEQELRCNGQELLSYAGPGFDHFRERGQA